MHALPVKAWRASPQFDGSAGVLSVRTADPYRGACFRVETFLHITQEG
jgi:hypothetical protein